jgi:hypothetical protein
LAVLGGDRSGAVERGRGGRGGRVGRGWCPVVSGGWRDAVGLHGPAVGAVPVACRARGDRCSSGAWLRGAGSHARARAVAVDDLQELRRNAATRDGGLEYRASTAQWHAERRARRPKPAKLAVNAELRRYVQDRLSGAVERPEGAVVDGPAVESIGRTQAAGAGGRGRGRGARSRSLTGFAWTSPMMSRCASPTRRFTTVATSPIASSDRRRAWRRRCRSPTRASRAGSNAPVQNLEDATVGEPIAFTDPGVRPRRCADAAERLMRLLDRRRAKSSASASRRT